MSYELVPLGELGEIVAGSTPDTNNQKYWGGDIAWITPADLTSHEGIYFTGELRKITEAGYKSCSTKMLPAGSILFSSRAPIGHCAVTSFPLCTNQGFKSIIPNERLDAVYGFFALKFFTPQIEALGRGATFAEVNKEIFENIKIPLPLLTEQKRIASLLARADRLRQLRRTAHDLGESLLQSVFLEMFGDIAVNPKGWDIATLEDLETDFIYGTSQKCFSEPKGLPVLRIPNVLHGSIDLEDLKYAEVPEKEAKNILLKHGDIIFVRTNGNPDYVGRCAVFNLEKDFLFASYLIRARLDLNKINPVFLLTFLQTSKGREAMAPYIRTTAGQSNIGIEGLGQIPVPIPPLSLQEEFAGVVRRVESLRGRMSEAGRQVEGLFDALLAQTMDGGR
jgi:type I restriction enzyme S subunit